MTIPSLAQATFDDAPSALTIRMPSARKPIFASLILVWLVLAVAFSRDLFTHVRSPADLAFALCALAFVLLWGAWALASLCNSLWGADIVVLSADQLTLRHDIRGIGKTQTYALSMIGNLRVAPPVSDALTLGSPLGVMRKTNGWIAFNYDSTTIRFGAGVDEAGARGIVERLAARLARDAGGAWSSR